jgi:hypothetical protein
MVAHVVNSLRGDEKRCDSLCTRCSSSWASAPSRRYNGPAVADKLDAGSIPTGAVYVCAAGTGKDRTIATSRLNENVAALCRRHTEMGPCQSARNECRSSGGRVYGADGSEITQADEAEYNKKVMRLRVGP